MTSPLNKKVGATSADAQYRSVLSHFPGSLAQSLDLQQMFVLIDGILPFEACLYYQVLPLKLEDNCLLLGMVNPEDSPAADYVRRIIAYHNYYPKPQPISSDALQASLSAYLHYTGSRTAQPSPPAGVEETDRSGDRANTRDEAEADRRPRVAPRIRTEQKLDRNTQPTLVVDSPEDLSQELAPPRFRPIYAPSDTPPAAPEPAPEPAQPEPIQPEPVQPALMAEPEGRLPENPFEPFPDLDSLSDVASASRADARPEPIHGEPKVALSRDSAEENPVSSPPTAKRSAEAPPSEAVFLDEDELAESISAIQRQEEPLPTPAIAPDIPLETLQDYLATFINVEQPPQVPTQLMTPIPPLVVQLNHLSRPAETLATLPPPELLQELLGRVLIGGIGRLYFEHQPRYGRILWSQNGVLQSVIDRLDLRHFRGIIAELKQLAGLPLVPVEQPRQVEIERLHERTRLLLRFRFIPTEQGEEATLQILRGAALKFYQQQQIATLERDALRIARQLQTKLNEIRDRARLESGMVAAKLEVLPALSQIIKTIEEQVDSLKPEPVDSPEDAPP
ncbi:hypothetical protein [Thermoleptolyngbya sp. M55_K2018_002]|uniref:GspE/PulE/PilB domain-containing protein n=1 Tax=Thermoleptolyngbya sp. M55_K2018_002 TaxID=2747808 RepID=UPI0025FCAC04|nr:hypothetical protein [Thermoleptolyngbya sp. M55_K2018_002]